MPDLWESLYLKYLPLSSALPLRGRSYVHNYAHGSAIQRRRIHGRASIRLLLVRRRGAGNASGSALGCVRMWYHVQSGRLGELECESGGIQESTYSQVAEDYHVILYVRQHQTIILEQDRAFNLSCSNPTSSSAAQVIRYLSEKSHLGLCKLEVFCSDDVITAGLRILDKDGVKTHETVYGESYTLQVFLTGVSGKARVGVKAKS